MGFEAWHGSRHGECFFMRGHEKPAAWFSFNRSEADSFAKLAWSEDNRLPTLCRVLISGRTEELFDADSDLDDPDTEANLVACLLSKGVSEYWIESILSNMRNYDFTAFDPEGGGTSSHLVSECIQELGFIGWMERERHLDDPQNFGLFDPGMRVQILEVFKFCPECERDLDESEEDAHTFECGSCEAVWRECDQCGELLEYDEDDDEWIYLCHCDLQMRKNPMTTVDDLRELIDDSPFHSQYEISDAAAFESAQSNYAKSFSDPDGYLEDHPVSVGYRHMHGRNYIFVGPKGRMLKVYAEDLQPIQGNIFYADKLKGLAVAPKFVDFKIPLFVGYVDPWLMSQGIYEEAVEYEDDFYEPDEDDIGEIFFQLRDGNHRTIATLLSGEPYAYVQVSANTYQDYSKWVEAGRPDKWPGGTTVLKYLDENLL